jgi:hypothetical protein
MRNRPAPGARQPSVATLVQLQLNSAPARSFCLARLAPTRPMSLRGAQPQSNLVRGRLRTVRAQQPGHAVARSLGGPGGAVAPGRKAGASLDASADPCRGCAQHDPRYLRPRVRGQHIQPAVRARRFACGCRACGKRFHIFFSEHGFMAMSPLDGDLFRLIASHLLSRPENGDAPSDARWS